MIKAYRQQADSLVLAGIVVQFVALATVPATAYWVHWPGSVGGLPWISVALFFAGWLLFILGCSAFARAKGYHRAWGLFGLLSLFGPVVLAFFPDRCIQRPGSGFEVIQPPRDAGPPK